MLMREGAGSESLLLNKVHLFGDGVMVCALDSGLNSPGSSPDCVVSLGKALYSHCTSSLQGV